MAESGQSLFNRGMISGRQAKKFGVLGAQRGTRTNPKFGAQEEPFAGRQGRGDQGGTRSVGSIGVDHLENIDLQGARKQFLPSKGGSAPSGGRIPHRAEIDEGERQRPEMPRGAGVLGRSANRTAPPFKRAPANKLAASKRGDRGANDRGPDNKTPRRARGASAASTREGGYYGGPSSRADG